ncbi:MAG: hypothetical protein ABI868_09790 [Acidobacteriota bacterium]
MRLMTAAAGTLILLLLSTSITEAGSPRRTQPRSDRTACGPSTGHRSTPAAKVRSFSRRVSFRIRQIVHRHVIPKLQRHHLKRLVDEDEAINPAVSGYDSPALIGALEPIGMLAVPLGQPTSHRTVSRRSPRGPPSSPA